MYYVFSKLLVPDAYVWEWGRLTICSMYQHALIITVYERLCNTGQNGQSDHRLFHMMPKSHQEACLSSARSISQLMRLHRSAWGVERMPQGTSQPINIALLVLLERLDVPENRDAFINLE